MPDHCEQCCPNRKNKRPHWIAKALIESFIYSSVTLATVLLFKWLGI